MIGNLLIGADIVPTKSNMGMFENGDVKSLIGEQLYRMLSVADYVVMNLETPITDILSPIKKCGPCLSVPEKSIVGIKAINPYFFTLANNHIMDQGTNGLMRTMTILQDAGIDFAGAGVNLEDAKKPFIRLIRKFKVGFYCCAEHEFSIATDISPGANPYDPLESFEHVKTLSQQCDYVIVLYHGGKEHYRFPSPMLQRIFRKFADNGANLVIAQHTHCVGCMEEYKNSKLIYGQGNFLFDNSDSDYWKTSILIRVFFDEEQNTKMELIPIEKKDNTVRLAEGETANMILDSFYLRSESIKKEGFISEEYERYAHEMEKEYLLRLHGIMSGSIIMRGLNKITNYNYIKMLYPNISRINVENVLACEAHNELAIQIMRAVKR